MLRLLPSEEKNVKPRVLGRICMQWQQENAIEQQIRGGIASYAPPAMHDPCTKRFFLWRSCSAAAIRFVALALLRASCDASK